MNDFEFIFVLCGGFVGALIGFVAATMIMAGAP